MADAPPRPCLFINPAGRVVHHQNPPASVKVSLFF
jgi:hypothetical protein